MVPKVLAIFAFVLVISAAEARKCSGPRCGEIGFRPEKLLVLPQPGNNFHDRLRGLYKKSLESINIAQRGPRKTVPKKVKRIPQTPGFQSRRLTLNSNAAAQVVIKISRQRYYRIKTHECTREFSLALWFLKQTR